MICQHHSVHVYQHDVTALMAVNCPSSGSSAIRFSESELAKFSTRYENGYDITTDERYNVWLEMFHSAEVRTAPRSSFACKYMYIKQYACTCTCRLDLLADMPRYTCQVAQTKRQLLTVHDLMLTHPLIYMC